MHTVFLLEVTRYGSSLVKLDLFFVQNSHHTYQVFVDVSPFVHQMPGEGITGQHSKQISLCCIRLHLKNKHYRSAFLDLSDTVDPLPKFLLYFG
jgi:hypothetical protein